MIGTLALAVALQAPEPFRRQFEAAVQNAEHALHWAYHNQCSNPERIATYARYTQELVRARAALPAILGDLAPAPEFIRVEAHHNRCGRIDEWQTSLTAVRHAFARLRAVWRQAS